MAPRLNYRRALIPMHGPPIDTCGRVGTIYMLFCYVQAVVISVDPKRQYLASQDDAPAPPCKLPAPIILEMAPGDIGPNGERYAW